MGHGPPARAGSLGNIGVVYGCTRIVITNKWAKNIRVQTRLKLLDCSINIGAAAGGSSPGPKNTALALRLTIVCHRVPLTG
jgi:hypothetical protein